MRRQHFITVFVALTAMACAYFLGRAQSPQPIGADASTNRSVGDAATNGKASAKARGTATTRAAAVLLPRDAQLKEFFSKLQIRADAGDVAAATRLYRDLSICNRIQSIDLATSGFADEILGEQVDAMKPEQLENYRAQLDAVESNKHNMQRLHNLCDGASNAMLQSLVPNLQKAAKLGEEHARACYLSRGPNYDASSFVNHPEWLATYRGSVPSMIDSGIATGDWKVVDILRNAYRPGAGDLLTGVLGADTYQYYRYLKLYRLGAEPYLVDKLNKQVAAAAAQLAPDQLAEADAWAETTFRHNFNAGNSTESTVSGWDPCGFPYE